MRAARAVLSFIVPLRLLPLEAICEAMRDLRAGRGH